MSFDIFLQHFRNGESVSARREGVQEILRDKIRRGPDQDGFYLVEFAEGRNVEFCGVGLHAGDWDEDFCGCAFFHCEMDAALIDLIHRLAVAADMVVFPSVENHLAVAVSDEQAAHLPSDVFDAFETAVVKSPEELALVLEGGYEAWAASDVFETPPNEPSRHR